MKKPLAMTAVLLMLWGFALPALAQSKPEIVISESTFLYQLNLMTADPAAYAGKTVEIEGVFGTFHYGAENDLHAYYEVFRYIPGSCCAADVTGLEVVLPDGNTAYPPDDTWVRAEGMLETYELDGVTYLRACLTALDTPAQEGSRLALP